MYVFPCAYLGGALINRFHFIAIYIVKINFIVYALLLITEPAKVENLRCVGDPSDMSLSLTWGEPMAQGSEVVGYSVEAQEVKRQQSSRQLESVPLMPAYDEEVNGAQARVTQGLGKNTAKVL